MIGRIAFSRYAKPTPSQTASECHLPLVPLVCLGVLRILNACVPWVLLISDISNWTVITYNNVLSAKYMPHCLNALCSLSASTSSDALIALSAVCPQ